MRRLLLILCCVIVAAVPEANAATAQYAFRITFKDKSGSPALSANPPWLSARSIARRTKFGIALDSTDRLVSHVYIDSVLFLTQGRMHVTSRWLNDCVILLTDSSKILLLNGKSWISSIAWVGYFDMGLHLRVTKADNPKFISEQKALSQAKTTGSPTYYGSSYAQTSLVNGDYLHDIGYTGAGKLIAVMDEGFAEVDTHIGFDSMRLQGRLLETYNFLHANSGVFVSSFHGTECLSTMAGYKPGTYVGSAPNAEYALYATEDGKFLDAIYELDNLIAGMERADSLGADIISASIVYNTFSSPYVSSFTKAELDGHTTNVSRAVNLAVAKGIFYTSSAGNEGGNGWDFLDSPGDADSALTIGMVNASRAPSSLSSPGPNSSGRVKPDLCLLGEPAAIFSTSNGLTFSVGTSFAAPQAAGYAACLMQAYPKATPYMIRQAMIRSADHFTNPTAQLGYGIPNFKNVYQYLSANGPVAGLEISVQPNPFNQSIEVRLPSIANVVEIALRDVLGRNIGISIRRAGSEISVSTEQPLAPGMYILHAMVDGKTATVKLMHF